MWLKSFIFYIVINLGWVARVAHYCTGVGPYLVLVTDIEASGITTVQKAAFVTLRHSSH
jgi:hypothetical protein